MLTTGAFERLMRSFNPNGLLYSRVTRLETTSPFFVMVCNISPEDSSWISGITSVQLAHRSQQDTVQPTLDIDKYIQLDAHQVLHVLGHAIHIRTPHRAVKGVRKQAPSLTTVIAVRCVVFRIHVASDAPDEIAAISNEVRPDDEHASGSPGYGA